MRNLFWQVSVSLDGFIEGPGGDLTHTAQVTDDAFERYATAMLQEIDGFIVGRRTYDLFFSYWPNATGPDADRLNALPKWVCSRKAQALAWNNARLLGGDVAQQVAGLKAQPGRDFALFGSANLAATLWRHGLIDELRLLTTPRLVGAGTPLFAVPSQPAALRLVRAESWPSGTTLSVYRKV